MKNSLLGVLVALLFLGDLNFSLAQGPPMRVEIQAKKYSNDYHIVP